jgi:PAS domain S-box-containing protein
MEKTFRKTGIDIIGDVPWGTHLCQFYQTKKDLIDILVPYFKAGLENNEFCMWITSEPLKVEDAKAALKKVVKNLDHFIKKGQIEILDYSEWYTKSGKFDANNVLRGWVEKENQALKRGYDGLRLSGNTFWLAERDWRNFTDYEEEVSNAIGKYRMIAICTYSLGQCGASEVVDVVSNHQFALIRREGKWVIIESSAQKRAVEEYRTILHTTMDGFWIADMQGRFWEVNDAYCCMIGYCRDELLTMRIQDVEAVERPEETARRIQKIMEVGGDRFETRHRCKDGRIIDIEVSVNYMEVGGGRMFVFLRDITDRKRTEEELRKRELFNFALFEYNPIQTVVVDPEGKVTGFNRAKKRAGDRLPNIGDVMYKDYAGMHEIDMYAELMKCIRSGEEKEFPEQKYGDKVLSITISPFPKGAVIISQDITDRKRMEEVLRESEEKYRTLFEESRDTIYITTQEGKFIDINQPGLELFGYTKEELMSLNVQETYANPDDRSRFQQEIEQKGFVRDYEVKLRKKDGTETDCLLTSSVSRANDGSILRYQGIIRDITERNQAEEERKRLLADLEAKNRELESFVYTISHDLKAPLVSLNGFSSVLQKEYESQLGEEGRHYLERIQANVVHMEALITSLLDLSRIGRVVGSIEEIDVGQLLREIRDRLAVRLKEAGAEFVVQEPLPTVRADRGRIYQVFANLIENAVKFRSAERALCIEVGCRQESGFYRFHVADNGIGIAPQYHEQIFTSFRKLHQEIEGVGIGLALVKKIVEHHGGRAWVESPSASPFDSAQGELRTSPSAEFIPSKAEGLSTGNERAGATFYFTLPIERGVEPLSRNSNLKGLS